MPRHVPRQSQEGTSLPPSSGDVTGVPQTSTPPSSVSEPASTPSSNVPSSSLPESNNQPSSTPPLPSSTPPESSSTQPLSSPPPSPSSQPPTSQPDLTVTDTPTTPAPPPSPTSFFTASTTETVDSASFTTFTTTLSDGSISTVTSLASPPKPGGTSSRIGLIAGTTAAGIIALLCILGVIFAYRRNKLRRFLEELTSKRKEHKGLLEDEDFDDDDHLGGPGAMRMHWDGGRDTPTSYTSTVTRGSQPSPSPAPSLFRACASESGSIFREEGVWPPPGKESEFVDPFVGHVRRASSEVDLTRIVDDVMGSGAVAAATKANSNATATLAPAAVAARLPPTADHSPISGSPGLSIVTSVSSNPAASPQPPFTLSPLSGAPPSSLPAGMLPPNAAPHHSDTLRTVSSTNTEARTNTGGTSTSASMYSDSGATARTDEMGLVSLGSTPVPPLIPPPPPRALPPRQQNQQQQHHHYGLPPGAARSFTPGMRTPQLRNDNDASAYRPSPPLTTTTTTTMMSPSVAHDGAPTLGPVVPVSGTLSESISELMSKGDSGSAGMGLLAVRAPLLSSMSSSPSQAAMSHETLARQQQWQQQQDGMGVGTSVGVGMNANGSKMLPSSQPKKSSPLARVSSTDAKIFTGK